MNPRPYELAPLLLALGRAGIELAPHPTDPARLRYRRFTPGGWATDLPLDLSARLRLHRAAVVGLLVDGYAPASDTDAEHVLCERLGVADGLGMPTHTGSAAWLLAAGESMSCSCDIATYELDSVYGSTDGCHRGGGEGERSNALCDRQGRGRGP